MTSEARYTDLVAGTGGREPEFPLVCRRSARSVGTTTMSRLLCIACMGAAFLLFADAAGAAQHSSRLALASVGAGQPSSITVSLSISFVPGVRALEAPTSRRTMRLTQQAPEGADVQGDVVDMSGLAIDQENGQVFVPGTGWLDADTFWELIYESPEKYPDAQLYYELFLLRMPPIDTSGSTGG